MPHPDLSDCSAMVPPDDARPYHHGDLPNALRAAAADLIAERGVSGFSLREVARRAGVSHAAPTHHFGDARGLLTSLAIEGFRHLDTALATAIAGVDDPIDQLARTGRAYVEVARSSPGHCAVMFRHDLLDTDDPAYGECGDGAHGRLTAVLGAVRDTYNPNLDVDLAAGLCWSAMQGLVQLHPNMAEVAERHDRRLADPGDLAERFARLLAEGFVAR